MMKFGVCIIFLLVAGCSATQSVITEYDSNGKVTRVSVSKSSLVKELTSATSNKTVIAWESGWAAYLSAAAATTQDPTPTVKMFAGKSDKGAISALPNQKNWEGIAKVIMATKQDLALTATGISNQSAK